MFAFWTYRYFLMLIGPVLPVLLWFRRIKGKEDPLRWSERRGLPSLVRPEGHLIWVHVASVGESLSVLPLINQILVKSPTSHILVTSTTVTSAAVLAKRLPARAFHQFVPVDRPLWVQRFFETWKPDLGLIVESELWPNLLYEARLQDVSLVLVNGRMSQRSANRWTNFKGFINHLLGSFSLCLVQDSEQVERYESLGAKNIVAAGNLKLVDNRKPNTGEQQGLNIGLDDRPAWLAASTHDGEEPIVIELHKRLRQKIPNLVTLLAPRHPVRRAQVLDLLNQNKLQFATRTSGASLEDNHEVYLIDTIGELTDFFNLAKVSLICGSLVQGVGGHNPVEGAQRGTAIVLGKYMDNFRVLTKDFLQAGAACQACSLDELESCVAELILDDTKRNKQTRQASEFLKLHENVLSNILHHLSPYLNADKLEGTASPDQVG
ncbi:MAG: 3-deoxy-D-manno-octulosonic acid transferase [Alphaproteobacteria bacterium]